MAQVTSADEVKRCPACGGVWPASRTCCLACGASLTDAPAGPLQQANLADRVDWSWLDGATQPEEAVDEAQPAIGPPASPGGLFQAVREAMRRLFSAFML